MSDEFEDDGLDDFLDESGEVPPEPAFTWKPTLRIFEAELEQLAGMMDNSHPRLSYTRAHIQGLLLKRAPDDRFESLMNTITDVQAFITTQKESHGK